METIVKADVEWAARLLEQGEVVAIPTETVYGLAANALDESAVEKIFQLKKRPKEDPLIVHVSGIEALERLEIEPPLWAERLMRLFWPGPLTILLPKGPKIPLLVTAGLERVALRAPAHSLTHALLQRLSFPLAAPSANPFGFISPTTPAHVLSYFQGQVPFILDGGPCAAGIESTIIGEEQGRFILYRPGALPREVIEEALGDRLFLKTGPSKAPVTPGQYPRHYAPSKPLLYGWHTLPVEPRASLVYFSAQVPSSHPYVHVLTPQGSVEEAAHHLYAILHACEAEPTDYILVEKVGGVGGLVEALHDRLRRAHTRSIFTIGHSNHAWVDFMKLIHRYEIQAVVDLRRQPYSKYVPHFSQGYLQKSLHEAGIAYEWQPNPKRLFLLLEKLFAQYLHIVLLCAEGDPTRCHRFRLADELTEMGLAVFHILPEGRLELHRAPISLALGKKA
ncbi:MAG: L-threonylcarbamoyladenylate synthase [Bacteroidia bacterium]|nr:L-threonylcarbamoyladenylate synthase [Bacteroidia bacterium]